MKKNIALIIASLFILNACTSSVDYDVTQPELTFEHLVSVPVNVSRINVTSETQRGAKAWDIANSLPTPPDTAMRRYLEQRYKPIGRDGVLNIHLDKATIIKRSIPNQNRLLSVIPLANNEDYTFEVIVDLETQYMSGQPNTNTSTRFVRKARMPVNVTVGYREAKLQRTLEEIIRDIDEKMILALSNQFGVIAKRNIPVKGVDVKTDLPKKQTVIGDTIYRIGEGDSSAREALEE